MTVGVVLMDYGGPEDLAGVARFLARLLGDPAILPLPPVIRPMVAHLIARRRTPHAMDKYRAIGGSSPLPAQVRALGSALGVHLGPDYLVRHAFRYCAPSPAQVVDELVGAVDRAVVLPLFPQHSGATTDTCLRAFTAAATGSGLTWTAVPSFPEQTGFLDAVMEGTLPLVEDGCHVLFVAHGLPRRSVDRGDPYVDEVRRTADQLGSRLPTGTTWSLAFQSRLGPVEWVRPYLEDEIARLADEGIPALVVVPVSFVTENLETRYDLDIEAADLASSVGLATYRRAPAPGRSEALVAALADLVRAAAPGVGDHGH